MKALLKNYLGAVLHLVRHEPVAAWGLTATLLINAIAAYFHLSAETVQVVSSFLVVLGIHVVRRKVFVSETVKALVDGAKGKST